MSFMITLNAMLGNILRMTCRNVLKIMLEDHVQLFVEDALKDGSEHYFQDHGQDDCLDYVAHVL